MRKSWLLTHKSKILTTTLLFLASTSLQATAHHPQTFLNSIQGQPTEAQEIVKHFCSNCHAERPLIPLGAPRLAHPEDWQTRLKQDPMVLWQHTNEGFHAMPARGGCFECTDDQLKKAILLLTGDPALKLP